MSPVRFELGDIIEFHHRGKQLTGKIIGRPDWSTGTYHPTVYTLPIPWRMSGSFWLCQEHREQRSDGFVATLPEYTVNTKDSSYTVCECQIKMPVSVQVELF